MGVSNPPPSRREFLSTTGALASLALAAQGAMAKTQDTLPIQLLNEWRVDPEVKFGMLKKWEGQPYAPAPDKDGIPSPPSNATLYRSMDLMVYLLRGRNNTETGVTYEMLYGPNAAQVHVILQNVILPRVTDDNHWGDHFIKEEKEHVAGKLNDLAKAIQGKSTTFRHIYKSSGKDDDLWDSSIRTICRTLRTIRQDSPQFCLPFIDTEWNNVQLADFLRVFGPFSLDQLLRLPKTTIETSESDGSLAKIKHRKSGGSLLKHEFRFGTPYPSSGDTSTMGGDECNPINYYQCTGGTPNPCTLVMPDHCFCTVAENGQCSILSCCSE